MTGATADAEPPYLHHRVLSNGGPPMIMLHGLLTGSIASWYLTVAPSFVADYEVVLYDQRGHGRSERTAGGYDLVTMRDDLVRIVGDRPSVVLVGHSYGALIALRYALDFPNRVAALIMVEPPLGGVKRRMGWGAALLKVAPTSAVTEKPTTRPERRAAARIRGLLDETNLVENVLSQPRFGRRELRACSTRSLTVFGAQSSNVHLVEQMRMMPHNTVEVIRGSHDLHITAADRLCQLFADFLRRGEQLRSG